MRLIVFMAPGFVLYVVILGVLGGFAAWRWRHRAGWHGWELASAVAPFFVWVGLFAADERGKSLSNLVDEPVLVAVIVAAISWARVSLAPLLAPSRAAVYAALVALTAAWLVWWAVPGLPE